MTDLTFFRVYGLPELGREGYPLVWDTCDICEGSGLTYVDEDEGIGIGCFRCGGAGSMKELVRQQAEHRCVRCAHPYRAGESGVWIEELVPRDFVGTTVTDPGRLFDELPKEAEYAGWARGQKVAKTKRVLYSPCDGRCDHPGPVRWKVPGERWHAATHATSAELRALVESEYTVEAPWRILTVHHLNGVKADLRWWNLASLCQRCHLEIQGKVQMERAFPFEHSPWFKIYAAGFYASKYEGVELTKEQATERMAELLAYEHVA